MKLEKRSCNLNCSREKRVYYDIYFQIRNKCCNTFFFFSCRMAMSSQRIWWFARNKPYLMDVPFFWQSKTRVHYNSDHPEFNQELNVQFKVSFFLICGVVCCLYACRCILWESLNGRNGEITTHPFYLSMGLGVSKQSRIFELTSLDIPRNNCTCFYSLYRALLSRKQITASGLGVSIFCISIHVTRPHHMIKWLLCKHSRRSCWTQISSTLWIFCR